MGVSLPSWPLTRVLKSTDCNCKGRRPVFKPNRKVRVRSIGGRFHFVSSSKLLTYIGNAKWLIIQLREKHQVVVIQLRERHQNVEIFFDCISCSKYVKHILTT